MSSRIDKTSKNIAISYFANFFIAILSLLSRTIFIKYLNVAYLGVNGLFSEILSILSFAELGIGNAIIFALYKPVAENDNEKIKSLMAFYKKAYRIIAIIIFGAGLILFPFLGIIVNDPGNIGNIKIYYLLFLFNSSFTYLVSYKYSYAYARQENYFVTIFETVSSLVTTIIQIIVLLIYKNFLVYLVSASIVLIFKLFFVSIFFDKKYPILKDKNIIPLSKNDTSKIKTNVFGLIWHKIGDICINQTDSLITQYYIDLSIVGLMSNYKMIMNTISSYISLLFTSAVPSLGNVVAIEDQKTKNNVFYVFNFVNFWVYGFSSIAFFILLKPTIILLWGERMIVDNVAIFFICINFYFSGQLAAYCHFKGAHGSFNDDKFVVIIASFVNLTLSVFLVNRIGLKGVYIGTVITTLFQLVVRPFISYKKLTKEKCTNYFYILFKYFISVSITGLITFLITLPIENSSLLSYFLKILIVIIIPNILLFIMYHNNEGFLYMKNIMKEKISRFLQNEQINSINQ